MNNQQIDKIVNFFRINHQFHDPYQLILDGNFIKILVEKQFDFKKKLDSIIKGRIILRVTSCIIRQLQLLGNHFKLVLEQAKQFTNISCKHSLQHTVDQCILDQIGHNNQRQFIVCSQDINLRRSLRQLQNVPIMYFGPDQRVTMEDIHKKTLANLKNEIKSKFLPLEKQMEEAQELSKKQGEIEKKKKIKQLSSQQGIQIKTKIAKGPNPLSVRKKKKKIPEKNEPKDQSKPKRKRIRKRNKKQTVVQVQSES